MNRSILLFLLPTAFIFYSCGDNTLDETGTSLVGESDSQRQYPGVDERLWDIFQNFESEAISRGINVNLESAGITGTIAAIDERNVVGFCSYGRRRLPNHIEIDETFWRRASTLAREYIVFHELGHCYLYRDHLEDCFGNRTWVSLMRSGTLNSCRDNYNAATRGYYIDELLGIETQ